MKKMELQMLTYKPRLTRLEWSAPKEAGVGRVLEKTSAATKKKQTTRNDHNNNHQVMKDLIYI